MEREPEIFQWKENCKQLNLYLKSSLKENSIISIELEKSKVENQTIQRHLELLKDEVKKLKKENETIRDENEALRKTNEDLGTLNEAVENVAATFCEESEKFKKEKQRVEKENIKIKRESAMLAQQFNVAIDFDFNDGLEPTPTPTPKTPFALEGVREIYEKKNEEEVEEERKKCAKYQKKCEELEAQLDSLNKQINEMKENSKVENSHKKAAEEARDLSIEAYHGLKEEYDNMLECCLPFMEMKKEYATLKRTSTILLSNAAEDKKYQMVFQISEELKKEASEKSEKIFKLESQLTEADQNVRQTEMKVLELEKKIESLTHENKILLEQKQGSGVLPPPPPSNVPPAPPKINIFNPLNRIRQNRRNGNKPNQGPDNKPNQDKKRENMMAELENKLKARIKNKIEIVKKIPVSNDANDSSTIKLPVKLRSLSVDSGPTKATKNEGTDFYNAFKKVKGQKLIEEQISDQNSVNNKCLIDNLPKKLNSDDEVFDENIKTEL